MENIKSMEHINGNNPSEKYQLYRTKIESISPEIFSDIRVKSSDPATVVNKMYIDHAESMARISGIHLTADTLKLYALLRDYHDKHIDMSDQVLLADVLYQEKKFDELNKFISAHPHIFN